MRKNDCFIVRQIGSKYFLVPFKKNTISNEFILINEIGQIIWENIDKMSIDDIANVIKSKYPKEQDITNDVRHFVDELLKIGLVIS